MTQNNISTSSTGYDQAKLFSTFDKLQFGEVHIKKVPENHFFSMIAIHSTTRGPSLGGCRFIPYPNPETAMIDVMRLAQSMSYKAAISNLKLGGGKAIIIYDPQITDRKAIFEAFGDFVDSLNGRYITSEDSGTHVEDMDIIAQRTKFVTGHSHIGYAIKDPSPLTALGVYRGMQACAAFHLNKSNLNGLNIVIQGIGNVGYGVAKLCVEDGAQVTVCDTNQSLVDKTQKELKVQTCHIDEVYDRPCDIFSPCALSNSINPQTLPRLQTKIIAGAANNQLSSREYPRLLKEKNVLYAPDYVINAGGLIHVCAQYYNEPEEQAKQQVTQIYDTLLEIFQQSAKTNQTTLEVANAIAESRLQ